MGGNCTKLLHKGEKLQKNASQRGKLQKVAFQQHRGEKVVKTEHKGEKLLFTNTEEEKLQKVEHGGKSCFTPMQRENFFLRHKIKKGLRKKRNGGKTTFIENTKFPQSVILHLCHAEKKELYCGGHSPHLIVSDTWPPLIGTHRTATLLFASLQAEARI